MPAEIFGLLFDRFLTHFLEYMVVAAVIVVSLPADVVVVAGVVSVAVVVIAGVHTVISGTVMIHVLLWSTLE